MWLSVFTVQEKKNMRMSVKGVQYSFTKEWNLIMKESEILINWYYVKYIEEWKTEKESCILVACLTANGQLWLGANCPHSMNMRPLIGSGCPNSWDVWVLPYNHLNSNIPLISDQFTGSRGRHPRQVSNHHLWEQGFRPKLNY